MTLWDRYLIEVEMVHVEIFLFKRKGLSLFCNINMKSLAYTKWSHDRKIKTCHLSNIFVLFHYIVDHIISYANKMS